MSFQRLLRHALLLYIFPVISPSTVHAVEITAVSPATAASDEEPWEDAFARWLDTAEARGATMTKRDALPLLREMAEQRILGHPMAMHEVELMDFLEESGELEMARRLYAKCREEWLIDLDAVEGGGWRGDFEREGFLNNISYWDGRLNYSPTIHSDILSRIKTYSNADDEKPNPKEEELRVNFSLRHTCGRMDAADFDAALRCAMTVDLGTNEVPDPRPLLRRLVNTGRTKEADAMRARWTARNPSWEQPGNPYGYSTINPIEEAIKQGGDLTSRCDAALKNKPSEALDWVTTLVDLGHLELARQCWTRHIRISDTKDYWSDKKIAYLTARDPDGPWKNWLHERLALDDAVWIGIADLSGRSRLAWLKGDAYCGERFLAALPKAASFTENEEKLGSSEFRRHLLMELHAWQEEFAAKKSTYVVNLIEECIQNILSNKTLTLDHWHFMALTREKQKDGRYKSVCKPLEPWLAKLWQERAGTVLAMEPLDPWNLPTALEMIRANPVPDVDPKWLLHRTASEKLSGFEWQILDNLREDYGFPPDSYSNRITRHELTDNLKHREWAAYWALSAHYMFKDPSDYGTGDRCMYPGQEEEARWTMMLKHMKPADLLTFLGAPIMADCTIGEPAWTTLMDWGAQHDASFPKEIRRRFPKWQERVDNWRFTRLRNQLGWNKFPQAQIISLPVRTEKASASPGK